MKTRIMNAGTGTVTLPPPFGNLLGPGRGVIKAVSATTALAYLGGADNVNACGLQLSEAPEGAPVDADLFNLVRVPPNKFVVQGSGDTGTILGSAATTDDRSIQFPDKDGVLATTDEVAQIFRGFAGANIQNGSFYLVGAGGNASVSRTVLGMVTADSTKLQLDVQMSTAPGTSNNTAFVVEKSVDNGGSWTEIDDSALTISNSSKEGHTLEKEVALTAGTWLAIKATASASANTAGVVSTLRAYN